MISVRTTLCCRSHPFHTAQPCKSGMLFSSRTIMLSTNTQIGGTLMNNYQAVFRRKEIKYLLSQRQLDALLPVLEQHMAPDDFAHSSISNLYYDTPDFRMIRRSLEKPKYKEKLRLRCYQTPLADTPAFLEIKKKASGIVYKRRASLPYAQALAYLSRRAPGGDDQIFHELDWMLRSYGDLAPSVVLSYARDSLKGKEDANLRLTLDRNILWRTEMPDLSRGIWGEQLLEPGQTLMEIKISNAMPLWLAEALSDCSVYPTSFSKYGRAYQTMFNRLFTGEEVKQYA